MDLPWRLDKNVLPLLHLCKVYVVPAETQHLSVHLKIFEDFKNKIKFFFLKFVFEGFRVSDSVLYLGHSSTHNDRLLRLLGLGTV